MAIETSEELWAKRDEVSRRYEEEFNYAKNYFLKKARTGKASLRKVLGILKTFDAGQTIALYKFLKEINPRSDLSELYRRLVAESRRDWGTPSYIITNVLNGIRQERVSKRTKAYRMAKAAVDSAKNEMKGRIRRLSLDGVVSVRDGDHYIAFVFGGNNGDSNWAAYFESLGRVVKKFRHAWLIELENDCCDDVHYALIGFQM